MIFRRGKSDIIHSTMFSNDEKAPLKTILQCCKPMLYDWYGDDNNVEHCTVRFVISVLTYNNFSFAAAQIDFSLLQYVVLIHLLKVNNLLSYLKE